MAKLVLPQQLLNEVEAGNVVLLLGAGASRSATNGSGGNPPLASELAALIANRFLTPAYKKSPLNQVAAFAESQSDLFTLQKFIADTYTGFRPTPSHHKLKTFRWKGIATTNYDTLIEDAYRDTGAVAAQKLVTFIDHSDRPDDSLVDRNHLLCLKLHGCVTRITNEQCPLILTTEQYNTHENGRKRLFNRLYDWAAEKPILFAGYSLQDANLLGLIQRLHKEVPSPPRSYLVTLGIDDIQKTYWDKFRITAINASFDTLVDTLDREIGPMFRGLRMTSEAGNLAISDRFSRIEATLTFNTTQFLEKDVDYVKTVVPQERIEPRQFYKGVNSDWSAIDQDLDVSRHLTDTILVSHILEDQAHPERCFIVVKAHAGAGKSVLLQRLAWEAARRYDRLCLKLRPGGSINSAAIQELLDNTNERIFLFVDNVIERRRELASLCSPSSPIAARVTIIGAARTNEWNIAPEDLTSLATDVYELPYLSTREVDGLLAKLEANNALGTLEKLNQQERQKAFLELADRQLLVALHEATLGKPFEEIIKDEYDRIVPSRAQNMYLSVCLLHQFGAPVRAGIISRMYNLPFEEFQKTFFSPLEQVIIAKRDQRQNDVTYMARHPHIAEIVVSTALSNREDLFHEVLKTLHYLNPSYNSDKGAFRKLVNGRSLLHKFPDHQMVTQIFEAAAQVSGEDADLLQQRCIYEMLRPNGNLAVAESLINKALSISKRSRALLHTQSELFIRRAEASTQPLARSNCLNEAIKICEQLKRNRDDVFPHYTLMKIRTLQIKDEMSTVEPNDEQIQIYVRSAEKSLHDGVAKHPDNPFLRSAEAELATALAEYDRAIRAMEQSFELNPRGSLIALRLADHYLKSSNVGKAVEILRSALAAKAGDVRLHSKYARILLDHKNGTDEEIIHHLRKSFVPSDANLEPRLLLGRQLFLTGNLDESNEVFSELRARYIPADVKDRLRFPDSGTHRGYVAFIEATYCMISRDGDAARLYCNRQDTDDSIWRQLSKDKRVRFSIAFCMKGARAYKLQVD